MNIVGWILRILVAAVFLISALLKLSTPKKSVRQFADYGYPEWFLYVVALTELAGAVGLLIPKTVQTAAGALIVLMLGALYTHFAHGDNPVMAAPAALLLLLLACIVLLRRRVQGAISL